MTEQAKTGAVRKCEQMEIPFKAVNGKVEFYMVEEGKAEAEVKGMFI